MDGMLSQDEINALLNGMDLSAGSEEAQPAEAETASVSAIDERLLTTEERVAVGDIANISMVSSATTLYSLVNHKVDITIPEVSLAR
ncbi:MAG: flagellar motor switch phosphatase FliY, partial [Lachnospiraceae bacterium]|nr:flagellar motor switch phosphatase FliY [Lachnospiraceae bacterium]